MALRSGVPSAGSMAVPLDVAGLAWAAYGGLLVSIIEGGNVATVEQLELSEDTLIAALADVDRSAESPVVLRVPLDLESFAVELVEFMECEHVLVQSDVERQAWALEASVRDDERVLAELAALAEEKGWSASLHAREIRKRGLRVPEGLREEEDEAAGLESEADAAEKEGDLERAEALRAEAAARSVSALDAAQAELDAEDSKAQELKGEAGEPVGPMPPAVEEGMHVAPDQILVRGTARKARKWAGKQPATTTIALKGVKFDSDGAFETGTRFRFEGEAVVVREGKKDVLDPQTLTASEAIAEYAAEVVDFAIEEQ